jgi:hypothetical protein
MLFLFLATAMVVFVISLARQEYTVAALLGILLLALVANALFVGALNGAAGRYQMRLAWMLAYATYLGTAVLILRQRSRANVHSPQT